MLGVNWSLVAALYEQRYAPGVIDMRMANDHGIDLANVDREGILVTLFFGPPTLNQATFQHYRMPGRA